MVYLLFYSVLLVWGFFEDGRYLFLFFSSQLTLKAFSASKPRNKLVHNHAVETLPILLHPVPTFSNTSPSAAKHRLFSQSTSTTNFRANIRKCIKGSQQPKLFFLQCWQAAAHSRNTSCKGCLTMGGGREKGLGTTIGADLGVDTARQDPQPTNRLGRFRIWALIVNPTHYYTSQGSCARQESQLRTLLEHSVSVWSPTQIRLQTHFHSVRIFYPT